MNKFKETLKIIEEGLLKPMDDTDISKLDSEMLTEFKESIFSIDLFDDLLKAPTKQEYFDSKLKNKVEIKEMISDTISKMHLSDPITIFNILSTTQQKQQRLFDLFEQAESLAANNSLKYIHEYNDNEILAIEWIPNTLISLSDILHRDPIMILIASKDKIIELKPK